MNQIDDSRVAFYVKHEKLIREWAGLEQECQALVHDYVVTCLDDLEDLARSLGEDMFVWSDTKDAKVPKLLIHRRGWTGTGGRPRVGIGLAWTHGKATFAGPSRPYTGVYVDLTQDGGPSLHGELKSRLKLKGVLQRTGYQLGTEWATWRYEDAPEGEYWLDLQGYREQLVKAVREGWELMSEHVDMAVNPTASVA